MQDGFVDEDSVEK